MWNQIDGLTYARATGHEFSTRAHSYYQQCLWYSWGMYDSGAYAGSITLDDGFCFAAIAMDAAESFDRGTAYCLRSILTMWDDYCLLIGARKAVA